MKKTTVRVFGLLLALALILGTLPAALAEGPAFVFAEREYRALTGLSFEVELEGDIPSTLKFYIEPKHRNIAKVNADTGMVTPLTKGTIKLYAVDTETKQYVSTTLSIDVNGVEWELNNTYDDEAIFLMPEKRVYNYNGKIVGEVYIYNNHFSAGISRLYSPSAGNFYMLLLDMETLDGNAGDITDALVAYAKIGKQINFGRRIGVDQYTTVRATFTKGAEGLDFTEETAAGYSRYFPYLFYGDALRIKDLGVKKIIPLP